MENYWSLISSTFNQIFNFVTPVGLTYGQIIVGVFGAPLLIAAYKKFF